MMKQIDYQIKNTAHSFTINLMWYIGIALVIIIILALSVNYSPPNNSIRYGQQFTPIIKHESSIGLLDKTIQKTNRIKSGIRAIIKFILIAIVVISATILILRLFEWMLNELKARINLFRMFGVFRSSSLANINL